ncbi:MAG: TIGR00282 family metallophosphoesterase [Armatimonadota bacterium]|nr:TIGR00282 family metallophosphoesterase [Armatimonadota bacterium]MDR7532338.1 TIGR00282 family metallophosphoesterase [Armatimonadota bacterium]MDR7535265.1 TIGR00282 family metallophosphoesterase [Armatimonadota bacterium]
MRILFVGDVTGRPGRRILARRLPQLRCEHAVNIVVANGENAAGGMGLTAEVAAELFAVGVDVLTGGNHIWKNREAYALLDSDPRVFRPANYPAGVPGRGAAVVRLADGTALGVLNLEGRVFMQALDDPFRIAREEAARLRAVTPAIIVDFHAEATSEKVAMGWYLDGRVSAVVGTHTHVQTADERVLPGGTAYITDVGMTGPRDGIIGMARESILERFLTQLPVRFEVAPGPVQLNAVVVEITEAGHATSIRRLQVVEED